MSGDPASQAAQISSKSRVSLDKIHETSLTILGNFYRKLHLKSILTAQYS
jgi:hypothetical protein